MTVQEAVDNYERGMRHCDNLVKVHRNAGTGLQGKRTIEVSINRAIVVLTVAAWQAFVEDITEAVLAVATALPATGPTLPRGQLSLLAGQVKKAIGDFATPNCENSRRLMGSAGFDPYADWTWTQPGGRAVGIITVTPQDVAGRINYWLRLRHDLAHGHDSLSPLPVLQAVRQLPGPPPPRWEPSLRLVDATACMGFFRRIAKLTALAASQHTGQPAPAWPAPESPA
jgi:hypothetical protein